MNEIAKVVLNNELDLILAYKRAIKLGELAGLALADQTAFATAVSEVAGDAFTHGPGTILTLGISPGRDCRLTAQLRIKNHRINDACYPGVQYARHLVANLTISENEQGSDVILKFPIQPPVADGIFDDWKAHFSDEPVISAYEEIRHQNRQLHKTTERLHQSETRYQTLTNSLPLMIFTVTNDNRFLYINKWLEDYTGSSLDSLNEKDWRTVVHADDAYKDWHWLEKLPHQTNFQNEIRIRNADTGEYVWHLVNATPVLSDQNKVLFWNGFLVNIHAQKIMDRALKDNQELQETKEQLVQYQQELQMNLGELQRSNQELAEFAYVASHDLQEPLRKIQSFGTLLLEQTTADLNPSARDMIQRMYAAAERMHVLIKDLLSYSRLNTHQQTFRTVDLNDLIGEVLIDLDLTIRERHAKIDLQPLPTVKGNALQLRQMFQNLLTNALKFRSPERPPRIQINIEKVNIFDIPVPMRNREPAYLAISVQDNGIGFDERYHDRIFQLFQRLHSRDQYPGTGIGLTICKKVAEMHGGTIAAQSEPGYGATFTVYLPASILVQMAVANE